MLVVPDPEKVGSSAPQDIPGLGVVVPCAVADSPYSEAEWDDLIAAGAPVLLHDDTAAADKESD